MAGSYNHVITDQGNLANPERVQGMLECVSGDVYEAVEEMFGMIWWLAGTFPSDSPEKIKARVEAAQENYKEGLKIAKQVNREA